MQKEEYIELNAKASDALTNADADLCEKEDDS